jgi:hypothetical protein
MELPAFAEGQQCGRGGDQWGLPAALPLPAAAAVVSCCGLHPAYLSCCIRWEALSSLERQLAGILLTGRGGGVMELADTSNALSQALIDALQNAGSEQKVGLHDRGPRLSYHFRLLMPLTAIACLPDHAGPYIHASDCRRSCILQMCWLSCQASTPWPLMRWETRRCCQAWQVCMLVACVCGVCVLAS